MIKMNFCMRKRPDRSLDQFSNYWREKHGPFAMSGRTSRLGMRRYVQTHLVMTPLASALADLVGPSSTPYEGICQLWFDSEDAVLKTRSTADGAAATQDLIEDERNFLDLPNCAARFYREEDCIHGAAGSGSHKLVLATSFEDAGDATRVGRDVAALLTSEAAASDVTKAVHNFGLDTPANDMLRKPRCTSEHGFDYILELWFADYASLTAAVLSTDGMLPRIVSALRNGDADGQVSAWIAAERVMINGEEILAAAA